MSSNYKYKHKKNNNLKNNLIKSNIKKQILKKTWKLLKRTLRFNAKN